MLWARNLQQASNRARLPICYRLSVLVSGICLHLRVEKGRTGLLGTVSRSLEKRTMCIVVINVIIYVQFMSHILVYGFLLKPWSTLLVPFLLLGPVFLIGFSCGRACHSALIFKPSHSSLSTDKSQLAFSYQVQRLPPLARASPANINIPVS